MKTLFTRVSLVAAVAAVLCAQPSIAQQPAPGYKDPGTATLIGVLVPGGGQIYSGETQRGLMLLGIGLGGLVVGTAITAGSADVSCDFDDFQCEDDTNYLPAAAGYLAYLGTWIYGIIDADDSAGRMNAKNGIAIGGAQVQPTVGVQSGGARVGLEVRF